MMRKRNALVILAAASAAALSLPATAQAAPGGGQGQAVGTPQRDPATPRGLLQVLARGVQGIERAIVATAGSNSRLQNLPDSP